MSFVISFFFDSVTVANVVYWIMQCVFVQRFVYLRFCFSDSTNGNPNLEIPITGFRGSTLRYGRDACPSPHVHCRSTAIMLGKPKICCPESVAIGPPGERAARVSLEMEVRDALCLLLRIINRKCSSPSRRGLKSPLCSKEEKSVLGSSVSPATIGEMKTGHSAAPSNVGGTQSSICSPPPDSHTESAGGTTALASTRVPSSSLRNTVPSYVQLWLGRRQKRSRRLALAAHDRG